MSAPNDSHPTDLPETPAPTRRPHPRPAVEDGGADAGESPPAFDFDRDLPGAVWMIPNRFWGFYNRNSTDHPGASVHHRARDVILVKGTDADHPRARRGHYVIAPTPANGLHKPTAFELVPRYLRLHRVRLLYPERHLGRLDLATLGALCEELARLWPEG